MRLATLLLLVIYIAFIGLGIPDSLIGAAWPAVYAEFGLPVSAAGCVTILISGCTIVSSLFSARIINRFGTASVTMASTLLTAGALLGFSLSRGLGWLCLFALPLGLGAGAVDTALNHFVALHYKASHMSFLHGFYGVGVALSPYLMSLALGREGDWRAGYRAAFLLQAVIAVITVLSLPLWRKVHPAAGPEKAARSKSLGIVSLARLPSVRTVWLIFIGSCGIEYVCGTWGSTFLVQGKGLPADSAAGIITFYYAGMTLGRLASGLAAARVSSWRIVHIGQGVTLAALLLLALPLPPVVSGAGLFLTGLGNGPVFPNLIHLTPQNFGADISQSVMGSQMACAYLGILLTPPLFGLLAQAAGIGFFPIFLLALFILMAGATIHAVGLLKRGGAMTAF